MELKDISLEDLLNSNKMVSKFDKQITRLLHILEDLDLDAVKLVKVATRLKCVRIERRYWKEVHCLACRMGVSKKHLKHLRNFPKHVQHNLDKGKKQAKNHFITEGL